jgi:hypothetical protein
MMRCGLKQDSTLHWVAIMGMKDQKYWLSDARYCMGLVWRRIPRVQQLFAFSVGEFKNQIGARAFKRLADQHY